VNGWIDGLCAECRASTNRRLIADIYGRRDALAEHREVIASSAKRLHLLWSYARRHLQPGEDTRTQDRARKATEVLPALLDEIEGLR
jgi:hypothetical protein